MNHRVHTARATILAIAIGVALTPAGVLADPSLSRQTGFIHDPALHDLHLRTTGEVEQIARTYGLDRYLLSGRATRFVTNCNDNGPGSLRATIASAVSGDIIDLRGLSCTTISLATGQITVPQESLSLVGNGPNRLTVRAGGGKYENRVFKHSGGGNFIIQGMTVRGGGVFGSSQSPSAGGGCIVSSGTVALGNGLFVGLPELGAVVTDCRAVGNQAGHGLATGGGIYAVNQVVMVNSRVSGCEARAYSDGDGLRIDGGGGVATNRLVMMNSELSNNLESGSKYGGGGAALLLHGAGGGDSIVLQSTITGNVARRGGGLSSGMPIEIRNSTISGNTAEDAGGVLVMGLGGEAVIDNTTITDNVITTDNFGGGLVGYGNTPLTLRSSIVWGNFRAYSVADDIGSNVTRSLQGSHNLVGVSTVGLPGDTVLNTDPHLQPLGFYGGQTRTHALRATSQAIGRGSNPADQQWDQRGPGYPRQIGQFVDIGAFEFDPADPFPDRIFANGFNP